MHEVGSYYVNNGTIFSRTNPDLGLDENIALLWDKSSCIVLRLGTMDLVTKCYDRLRTKYKKQGNKEGYDSLVLLTFTADYPEFNFIPSEGMCDIDTVCTILNWLCNGSASADKLSRLFGQNKTEYNALISQLQEIGF